MQIPFEKEFSTQVEIPSITQLDIEQQREILNAKFPLMLKVRAVLPPKKSEVVETSLTPEWENEIRRKGFIEALDTHLLLLEQMVE